MSVDERILGVVDALYVAAVDEVLWSDALKKLTDLTGSQAASFWVLDGSAQPRLPTFTYINLDPEFIQEYLDQMAPLDPTVQYLVDHPSPSCATACSSPSVKKTVTPTTTGITATAKRAFGWSAR